MTGYIEEVLNIYVHTLAMHDLPVGGSNRRFVSEKEAPNVDSPQ
jgi:hypothetical protein